MRRRSTALSTIALFALLPPLSAAEPSANIDTVLKAWSAQATQIHAIDIHAEGKGCILKGTLTEDAKRLSSMPIVGEFPSEDHLFPVRYRLAARLRDKRFRKEIVESRLMQVKDGPATFYDEHLWTLYDGTHGYKFVPEEHYARGPKGATQVWLASPASIGAIIDPRDYPIVLALGIVPSMDRNISLEDLASGPTAPPYRIEAVTTRGFLVLRTAALSDGTRFDEVWADPARGYIIVKYVMNGGGEPVVSIDLTYERRSKMWALAGWRYERLLSGRIVSWYEMSVTRHEVNPQLADSQFQVEQRPGMVVLDESTAEHFVIGQTANDRIPLAVALARQTATPRGLSLWLSVGGGVLAVVTIALGILVLIWRRSSG